MAGGAEVTDGTGDATGVLRIEGLGKAYRRYPTRWSRLAEWMRPSRPRHAPQWVLRGLDLTVPRGQSVGIIGRNGAGKSTLLKVITGTSPPTEGQVALHGRVAALLELGMGFHPEFTGRQNAWIAAQLLGLRDAEIDAALPEIERFAEIGPAIDEPVRTYSSGMQMRLAFSVATAVRPDILIVDEALSVGDAYFQHKCFARIRAFRRAGTTLLFVSHDPGAVKTLCDRAVLLDAGRVVADDAPDRVLDLYNALIADRENRVLAEAAAGPTADGGTAGQRSGNGKARIDAVTLSGARGPARVFRVGEPLRLRVNLRNLAAGDGLTVGFSIRDRLGNEVFGTNSWHMAVPGLSTLKAGEAGTVTWEIPALHIGPGHYAVSVALHGHMTHVDDSHDWWDQAAQLEVVRGHEHFFEGVCHLQGVRGTFDRIEGPA